MWKKFNRIFQNKFNKTYFGLSALTIFICILMGIGQPQFLSIANILNIGYQMSMIAIMSFGVNAVIISNGTDLSSGGVLGLSGMVGVIAYTHGLPPLLSLILMVAVGAAAGVLNGVLVSYLDISPFIATYGVMSLCKGITVSICNSAPVLFENATICWLGSATIFGVPVAILVMLIMFAAWWFLMNRTLLGRYFYAVGGNYEASRASGINARLVRLSAYVLAGLSAGIAGMIFVGRLQSAQPLAGQGMEFEVLTAVFIGGASFTGGSGRVGGAFFGAFLMTLVRTMLSFLGTEQHFTYILTGAMILFSVMIHQTGMWESVKTFFARIGTDMQHMFSKTKGQTGTAAEKQADHVLEIKGIGKCFGSFKALDGINAVFHSGDIVALLGENGAGKSTFVNVLSGVFRESAGEMFLDGRKIVFHSPEDSKRAGIGVIHQHYSLVPELTVAQNLFYNQEPKSMGFIRVRRMNQMAKECLKQFDIDIPVKTKAYKLTVGQSQIIEIIKATIQNPWLLIMDEPTSSLSNVESEHLYRLIHKIQENNVAILFISHKLEEVFRLCRSALVLRDGQLVRTVDDISKHTDSQLIEMMVGRELTEIFPYTPTEKGEVIFEAEDISDGIMVNNVSLKIHAGEVVGLAGLMGSGRTEAVECMYGLRKKTSGSIIVNNKEVTHIKSTRMLDLSVGLVPEDRHKSGIIQQSSIADNLTLIWNRKNNMCGVLKIRNIKKRVSDMIEEFNIKPANPSLDTVNLSGGNQQKVVLGKWGMVKPRILILDDPTRGIDVGAKREIHNIIAGYKKEGAAVLIISSELQEVLNIADRIYVMHKGSIAKELPHGVTESEVMRYAFGLNAAQDL